MLAVFWKEMADNFGRRRFVFLLGIAVVGVLWAWFVTVREVQGGARSADELLFLQIFVSSSGVVPSLLFFIGFFGPLLGIVLGFDSINSERVQGTLSRVLSQPVFRDAVFNGKFLAGIVSLGVLLIGMTIAVIGLAMFLLGFAPRGDEVIRIIGFTLVTIAYVAFWLALAMTCSVFFRNTVTSALVSIGLWLFTAFFLALLIAPALADIVVGPPFETAEDELRNANVQMWTSRASPFKLFSEASETLLNPGVRSLGPLLLEQTSRLLATPISASQSLRLVWPHIVVLLALVATLLGISYTKFIREEIRA